MSLIQKALSPVVELRKEEGLTALLMFSYSFLAMTAYNAIKPLTRSKFISDLGADNLPYVLLVAGFVIGVLMAAYTWLIGRLPRRWALPIVQFGLAGVLLVFWVLFGATKAPWVSASFYVAGAMTQKHPTHTKKTPGSRAKRSKRKAYQNSTTFVAKNTSVPAATLRLPKRATTRV